MFRHLNELMAIQMSRNQFGDDTSLRLCLGRKVGYVSFKKCEENSLDRIERVADDLSDIVKFFLVTFFYMIIFFLIA